MNNEKSTRGFASMSPERRSEIAAKGARRAHELGKAHKFTSETGKAAGLKGGKGRHKNYNKKS